MKIRLTFSGTKRPYLTYSQSLAHLIRLFRVFFTHGNRRATEHEDVGCFPDGDESLQPLSGDTAGPGHGRAGAAGGVEFSPGAPLSATGRRRLVARGG